MSAALPFTVERDPKLASDLPPERRCEAVDAQGRVCGASLDGRRADARYCSAACRKRAERGEAEAVVLSRETVDVLVEHCIVPPGLAETPREASNAALLWIEAVCRLGYVTALSQINEAMMDDFGHGDELEADELTSKSLWDV